MSNAEVERCAVCGFAWAEVPAADVASRLEAAARQIVGHLARHPQRSLLRRTPDEWSAVEYAAHVRDVCLHVRDRLIISSVEDNPEFKPLYRDQRVDFGLYRGDAPDLVATELLMAANLFARTFVRLDAGQLARTGQYAFPTLQTRTVLWMGQQVVHEAEHHRGDVDTILA